MITRFLPFHEIAGLIAPNVEKHYAAMSDIDEYGTPNIDWDYYITASVAGQCVAAAMFDGDNLVGYSVFTIGNNPRYKHILQASNEAIYIEPEHRGKGLRFIKDADNFLKSRGVHETFYLWADSRTSKILQRLGYKPKYKLWGIRYE
jgi:GNAT superfamily N-acetyltransferase